MQGTGLPLIVQLQMHMDTRDLLSFGFYEANGIDCKAFCRKPAYECLCKHTCIWTCMYVFMCAHTYTHTHTHLHSFSTKKEITLVAHGKSPTSNKN